MMSLLTSMTSLLINLDDVIMMPLSNLYDITINLYDVTINLYDVPIN